VNITGAGFVSLLLLYHPPDLSSPGIPLPAGRVDRRRPSMSYAGQHITLTPSRTSHPRAMPHQFYSRPSVRPSAVGQNAYLRCDHAMCFQRVLIRPIRTIFLCLWSYLFICDLFILFFAAFLPSLIKCHLSLSLSLSML